MRPQARSAAISGNAFGSGGPRDPRRARAGSVHAGTIGRGLVVLDHAVPDPGGFLAAVPSGFDVLRLGPSAEPLAALLRFLDGAPPYASLHVVSHGRPGALLLAGRTVDGRLLRQRRIEVEAIGRRLMQPADVFLYGCEVARGTEGRTFVEVLATLLGAGVAASATPTGSALHGGDWRLEVAAGRPTGRQVFGAREMSAYGGLLAAPSTTLATGWVDVVKGTAFDPSGDAQAGTAGLDLVGDASRALLQAQSYTAADGTAYTGFRILYGGNSPGTYYFVGFDADGNGSLDAFLCVKPSGGGAGVYVYDADPTKPNDSPSNTGIVDTAANARIALTNASYGSVAVDAGSSRYVVWVATNDLIAAINAKSGAGINGSSPLSYLVFTATQDNSINGDLGGAATNSTQTFTSLGVLTRQSLSAPAAVSVPAPTGLALVQDTGDSPSDRVTANGAVTGTAQAGATVTLREGSTVLGTATADGSGRWTIAPANLAQGSHTVTATASDGSGNTGPASPGLTYTFDTLAPAAAITSPGGPTNQAAQTISGTAETGSTVTLRDGAVVLGTATAGAGGTWSVAVTLSGQGAHSLTARATDAAGNAGTTSSAVTYTLDTAAPTVGSVTASGIGISSGNGALGVGKTVTLTLAMSEAITVDTGGGTPTLALGNGGTATYSGGSGTNALTFTYTVAAGQDTPDLAVTGGGLNGGTIKDAAGNPADLAGAATNPPGTLVIDTVAPAITVGLASDTGGSPMDKVTSNPALTGTAEAGTVKVSVDGGAAASVGVNGTSWSYTPVGLADGAHTVTVNETDAAGNTGSTSFAFTLDKMAPTVGIDAISGDDAVNAAEAAADFAIGGTTTGAESGRTVTVKIVDASGAVQDTYTTTAGSGTWSVDVTAARAQALANGAYTVEADVSDLAGNAATRATRVLTLDKAAPAVTITGAGGPTNRAAQTVTGTGEAGTTVHVFDATTGSTVDLGTAVVGGDGTWNKSVTLTGQGAHSLTATATDAAGNTGTSATAVGYTLDTGAPTVGAVTASSAGLNGGTGTLGVGKTATLTLAMSEVVTVTGTPTLTLNNGGTAAYSGGSGTNALTFTYTVAAGQDTPDLAVTAVDLPGGAAIGDAAGNPADLAGAAANPPGTLVIDTAAPGAPTISFTPDTGASSTDGITTGNASHQVTLNGTAEAGSTVEIYDDGGSTPVATVTATGGSWSYTTTGLTEGAHAFTAVATDGAGNTGGPSGAVAFKLDTAAPAAPTIDGTGGPTGSATQTVSGTTEAGSTVTIYDGNVAIGTTTADGGAWSTSVTLPNQGANRLTATATDAAGNTGAPSTAVTYTLDGVAPGAPTISRVIDDFGTMRDALAGGGVTDDAVLSVQVGLAGTGAVAGDTLRLHDGSTALSTVHTLTDADINAGYATVATDTLANGTTYHIAAVVTDAAGNRGAASAAFAVTEDAEAPPAPAITSPGGPTDRAAQTVTGTAEAGGTVELFDGAVSLGTATAGADGSWSVDVTLPGEGAHSLMAKATDAAGNTGAGATVSYTLDMRAPAVGPVAASPGTGTLKAGGSVTFTVALDEAITVTQGAGGGAPTLILNNGGTATYTGTDQSGKVLTFGYTVQPGQDTADLRVTGTALNGATILDVAGNPADLSGAVADPAGTLAVDTTAPPAPPLILTLDDAGPVTGTLANGASTDDTDLAVTVDLAGTGAQAGDVVRLHDGTGATTPLGSPYTLTSADIAAGFAALQTGTLADGTTYAITARLTDAAGNQGAASAAFTVTEDTTAPVPAITGAGGVTNQAARTISGATDAGEAGGTVTLYDGATALGTATVRGDGRWSTGVTLTGEGAHSITAVATDAAGNTGTSPAVSYTLDTREPAVTGIAADAAPGTALNAGTTVTFTVAAGEAVTVGGRPVLVLSNGATAAYTGTGADGRTLGFAYTVEGGQDTSDLRVGGLRGGTITDAAGNALDATGAVLDTGVAVDTAAPFAPAITGFTPDTGAAGDGITAGDASHQVTLSGTAEAGGTVSIYDNGGVTPMATVTVVGGDWTYTTTGLAEGEHAFTATATDAAGNTGAVSNRLVVTLSTAAPLFPSIAAVTDDAGPVTGALARGASTDDTDLTVRVDLPTDGSSKAGDTVRLYDGTGTAKPLGGPYTLTGADIGNGYATLQTGALAGGTTYAITARITDAAGNQGAASAAFAVSEDTATPPAPTITGTGGPTNRPTRTVAGTAEANSTVELFDGAVSLGTVTADADGAWSMGVTLTGEGAHGLTATATDAAGNASPTSAALALTIDTTPPVVVAALLHDTGPSGTDRITSDATLAGDGDPGAIVTVSEDGRVLGSTLADAAGHWTLALRPLTAGAHTLDVGQTDAAGNTGTARVNLTLDAAPPAAPAGLALASAPGSGAGGDGATGATRPVIVGTAETGTTVTLLDDGAELGTAVAGQDGTWSFVPTAPLGDGTHRLTATATDAAGNVSTASAPFALTIDATPPALPAAPALDALSDGGAEGDGVTDVAMPTLTGTAEPGSTVTLTDGPGDDAVALGTARADGTGRWSFTPTAALSEGTHSVTATATDTAGNVSSASAPLALTIDTGAPSAPVGVALASASDSGTTGDGRTNATAPTLTGTAEPGSTVTVSDGAVRLGTARADATGRWSFTGPALSDGVHPVTATATDAAGNVSPTSVILALTIDSASPAAPSAFAVAPGNDSGTEGDGRTNVTAPTLTGTAEAGSTVTLVDGSSGTAVLLGSVQADGAGYWSLAVPTLAEGEHSITATATDAEGNASPASAALALTIDTTAAKVTRISAFPAGGVLGAGQTVTFILTTSEALRVDTTAGNPSLLLSDGGTATYSGTSDDGALVFTATVAPGRNSPGLKVVGFAPNGAILTDAAGNPADLSGIQTVAGADTGLVIDTAAPAAPSALALAPGSDGGIEGDGLTNSGTPTLTGMAEPGSTVTLTTGDAPLGTARADGDGRWSVTPGTLLDDGTYQIAAVATDAAGNTSAASGTFTLTISTVAPIAPAGLDFASGSDGGVEGDGLTNIAAPTLTGTAEPGSTVTLMDRTGGRSSVLGTVRADGTGHWSFTGPTLADGAHGITAAVTDAAGNTAIGAALDFVLDSVLPTVTGIAAVGDRLTISYSETVDLAGPASGAYSVTVNGVAASVTGVAIDPEARMVVLTLATPVLHGDGVVVSYSGVGLGDAAGNTAPAFAPFSATNLTGDRTAPVPRLGVVNGTRLVLGLTEEGGLAATAPAADAFAVRAGDRVVAVSSAEVDPTANVVVLTLSDPIGFGVAVTLDYAAPADAARAVRDGAGNPLADFAGLRVTNAAADTASPVPVAATYAGSTVTLALTDASPLDAADPPSAAAFSVVRTTGASSVVLRPSGVIVDPLGKSVTLILPQSLTGASSVLLGYTDPGQGAPGPLADTWHNRVASFDRFVVAPEDRDGVAPEEEAGVPGLPGAQGLVVPGDGNGDGVPDAVQPDVASFGFAPPGATNPAPTSHATLVAVSDSADRSVAQLSDVAQQNTVADAPGGMVAPFGEFRFRSTVDTPGGVQAFHLILPDDPRVTGYWKLNRLSGRWEDIATSVDRSKPGVVTLGFSIQDGGAFDDDGVVDGAIFDPGVPGSLAPVGPAGDPPMPSVSTLVVNRAAPAVSGSWGGTNGGTDSLSVGVGGITYTAGASPALRVSGTTWSLQLPALGDGTYAVAAVATRAGGGSARATVEDALTIDTVAPSVTIGLTRDSNAFRTVGVLRTEALTGTATPGATLTLNDGGAVIGTVQADAAGVWLFRPTGSGETGPGDGARTISVQEVDAAGNVGSASLAFSPVVAPTAAGGVGTAEWRSMDLAELLNGGGELRFIAGTERVLLADGTLSVGADTNEAFLTRLYHGLLGRAPEAEGIAWWQHFHVHGASKTALAEGFLRSAEYDAGNAGQTDARFVQELYQGVLGREGAAWEVALWAEQLDAGRTRAAVLADVADAPEAKQRWARVVSEGVWVRDADAAVVREAYLAAFGREADAGGLRFWTGALGSGATPGQVGAGIGASAEFQTRHAQEDDARFVESLYANGLGRPGEAQGVAGWVEALRTGAMTRGDVLMDFARSAEGQHHLYWAL